MFWDIRSGLKIRGLPTMVCRVENKPVLIPMIEDCHDKPRPAQEWADLLDEVGVPNAPVQTIDQVATHRTDTRHLKFFAAHTGLKPAILRSADDHLMAIVPGRDEPAPALGCDDEEISGAAD